MLVTADGAYLTADHCTEASDVVADGSHFGLKAPIPASVPGHFSQQDMIAAVATLANSGVFIIFGRPAGKKGTTRLGSPSKCNETRLL